MEHNFSYIDLFAGCGGLSLGLHNAGWRGLFAIEKSPAAFKTLKHNLIEKRGHFDWVKWLDQTHHDIDAVIEKYSNDLRSLRGKVDLIAGGPPCQGFSTAGRRRENDARNELINSYIRFVKLVQPKIIFFENVKGFTLEFKKNKNKGRVYSSYVERELNRAGYYTRGKLVNFADYGVPQKRTRFVLIGIKKSVVKYRNQVVNKFFDGLVANKELFLTKKNLPQTPNLEDAISDLLELNGKEPCPDNKVFNLGRYSRTSNPYQRFMRRAVRRRVADSHRFANHTSEVVEKFRYILNQKRRNRSVDKSIREKYKIKKHTIVPLDPQDQSPTLTTLPDDYIHYLEPRILTVREYARIQTFPDWYEFREKYTTGGKNRRVEVPRYTQVGNAVPPLFAEQSGIVLMEFLK